MRIFLAGATGVVGRRLVPLLVAAGHTVFGTTRSPGRARDLAERGARPVVVDAFDRTGVAQAMREAAPDAVIHQLTDLPQALSGPPSQEILEANARVRIEGTRNLVDAALAAGAKRFVAQSVAWLYAKGREPHTEGDPLDTSAPGPTIRGVLALEQMTLHSPPLEGVVLRYGQLYGPGTWNAAPKGPLPLHVDAAARAALLAVESPHAGIFNVAEETGYLSAERARALLGWSASV